LCDELGLDGGLDEASGSLKYISAYVHGYFDLFADCWCIAVCKADDESLVRLVVRVLDSFPALIDVIFGSITVRLGLLTLEWSKYLTVW
jgi:hypothetical protein